MSTGSVRIIKMFLAAITMFFLFGMTCQAEEVYQNPDTGYSVVVEDAEELVPEVKRTQMTEIMKFVSNTLLGLVVGLLLTYAGVSWWYRQHIPQVEDKAEMFLADIRFQDIRMNNETTEETYNPHGKDRLYPKEIDHLGYGRNVDNYRGGFRR